MQSLVRARRHRRFDDGVRGCLGKARISGPQRSDNPDTCQTNHRTRESGRTRARAAVRLSIEVLVKVGGLTRARGETAAPSSALPSPANARRRGAEEMVTHVYLCVGAVGEFFDFVTDCFIASCVPIDNPHSQHPTLLPSQKSYQSSQVYRAQLGASMKRRQRQPSCYRNGAFCTGTIAFPIGHSASPASFKCAQDEVAERPPPSGEKQAYLPITPNEPVPTSSRPKYSPRGTAL